MNQRERFSQSFFQARYCFFPLEGQRELLKPGYPFQKLFDIMKNMLLVLALINLSFLSGQGVGGESDEN